MEKTLYGEWWEGGERERPSSAQALHAVQIRFEELLVLPPAGTELTAAGYEYYPQALDT